MKYNKLGSILLIIFVVFMVLNAVSAEDNTLVGAENGKLMVENDDVAVVEDVSHDGNVKLGASNSEVLKAGGTGNYTELQELINSHPNGGVINLDKDYAWVDSDPIWITVNSYTTINGNGHKISGENQKMSFYIEPGKNYITLNNITFVNGKGNSMLWIAGNDCLVDNCTFENNHASKSGGALKIVGPYNTVSNSKFVGNTAQTYGGAAYLSQYDVTVRNCTFIDNEADYGGAAYFGSLDSVIENCTFNENHAYSYAGAVYVNNRNTIDKCKFNNNNADSLGGAVAMQYTGGIVNNSEFNRNDAYFGGAVYVGHAGNLINNSKFNENSVDSQSQGAALYITAANTTVLNSEFMNHNAYDGGAIYWFAVNGTVKGSTFTNNTAKSCGGAIHWEGNGSIEDCHFNNDSAGSRGGAVNIQKNNVNIKGSDFTNNSAGLYGGAVYINNKVTDQVISSSTFTNNTVNKRSFSDKNGGGAVYIAGNRTHIKDSTFDKNHVERYGGAVFVEGSDCTIERTGFNNNNASYGGAIYWEGDDGSLIHSWDIYENNAIEGGAVNWIGENGYIYNSRLHHNNASDGGALYLDVAANIKYSHFDENTAYYGAGIYVSRNADGTQIDHTNFGRNLASSDGGAIYWVANDGILNNSVFYNNGALSKESGAQGGAVFWDGDNALVNNSKFILNYVTSYNGGSDGGALHFEDHNARVENSLFENNTAGSNGGAIRWEGDHGVVFNSTFYGNTAPVEGGAIDGNGQNLVINQSTFSNNKALAYVGGAVALNAYGTIDNSTFEENFAYKGGAIHWIDEGYCIINNSYFARNHAVYAGGAVACDYYYFHANKFIQNTRFVNNSCVNYGGAVASLNTEMDNCTFINNSANMGGAIHSYDSIINSSRFSGNKANYGNDIHHSGTLDLINIHVPDLNIVYVPSGLAEIVQYDIGNSTRLMNNSYIGMCFERNSFLPKYGAYDESLHALINVLTGESIVDYLKLLIYDSFNSMEDVYSHEGDNYTLYPEGLEGTPESADKSNWIPISRTDYYSRVVHIFSDHDFRKSEHPEVKRILALYNNGTRISQDHLKWVNGTLVRYHFSTLISPASQSLFLFLISPVPKIDKINLNSTETIYVNDTIAFNITVNNTSDRPLINVTINEVYNSTEFEYVGHSDNKTWIKNNNTFTYYHEPDVGDIVIYDVIFNNTGNCNLEDIVFSNVYDPEIMEYVKTTGAIVVKDGENFILDQVLDQGKVLKFSMWFRILNNESEIYEMSPNVLDYKLGASRLPVPKEPGITVKKTYVGRYSAIPVGEKSTLTIWFKVKANGTLVNNVTFNGFSFREIVAGNNTTVYRPDMEVQKIALNKTVYVGNETTFTIVVKNTGDCDLNNVSVVEDVPKGLRYDGKFTGENWYNNGNKFIYVGVLKPGESAAFNVTFTAINNGTWLNSVNATSNLTKNKTGNNTTTVYSPNMTVEKITLNKTVYVGNQTMFEIIVRNTGDCDLGDVTVYEKSYTGLVYDSYVNGTGNWKRVGDKYVLDGILSKGANATFTVIFNTTKRGNFTNIVVAGSNVTENKTTNNNTTVLQPNMTVQKIALNKTAYVGDEVIFTIVVTNTGDCDLGKIKVVEDVPKGLRYDNKFTGKNWYNNANEFIYNGILKPGESASFNITFTAVVNGTWLNSVNASSNVTENKSGNNTTTVYSPNMTVEKISLNKTVYIGNETTFVIVVNNTGDCDLSRIRVTEKFEEGLRFDGKYQGENWFRNGNVFIYDGILKPGESARFNITFIALTNGTWRNTVVASSNSTENKSSNNTTEVLKPLTVSVVKVWNDHDDQDGVRPAEVTVILYADGVEVKRATLNDTNGWKYSFEKLPVYNNGNKIVYTLGELPVDKYVTKISGSNRSFVITNSHESLVRNVSVSKVWSDNDNQDGVRPVNVTVVLYADGVAVDEITLNESNSWKHVFEHLDVYHEHGHVINYTVGEKAVSNYTVKITADNGVFVINNTHVPAVTAVNVSKVWNDHDDQDGLRPSEVTVILYADGNEVNRTVLNVLGSWKYSFENLPVYSKGNKIVYTVSELPVDKYVAKISNINGSFVITNSHESLVRNVSVSKVWSDNDNQDGVRPQNITVVLFADGVAVDEITLNESNDWKHVFEHLDVYHEHGHVINYTIGEIAVSNYTVKVTTDNGVFVINNTHVPAETQISVSKVWNDNANQDGVRPVNVTVVLFADGVAVDEITLNESNGWKYVFEHLPVYSEGKVIVYTIGEIAVANYSVNVTGVNGSFVVNNTHVPSVTEINVSKVWNDHNDQDGVRPSQVTVLLYADGVEVQRVTLNDTNVWKYSFENLAVYNNGSKIVYTVGELPVDKYVARISGANGSFVITNIHESLATSVNVSKVWSDNENQDGLRPVNVTVVLFADGVQFEEAVLNASNGWKYSFENLPVYHDHGHIINYTVGEIAVAGYAANITGENGVFVINNTHVPAVTAVNVSKVWNDHNDQDGVRPSEVTVILYADGAEVNRTVLNVLGSWKYSFENLPVYSKGNKIVYTVGEIPVDRYVARISGANGSFVITNIHESLVTSVNVSKVWSDNANQDGVRPAEVTVILFADGVQFEVAVLNVTNGWKYSFENLPVYHDHGHVINYTVGEVEVANYTASVTGGNGVFVINNTHVPAVTQISVSKVWSDNANQDGVRPSSITVVLFADGVKAGEVTLTEKDGWKASFENLLVYAGGKVINYTIGEIEVANYTSSISQVNGGFVVNNTHVPAVTAVNVSKVWNDNANQDGVRPSGITVVLFADGVKAGEITVTASDDWKASFENLPVYANGKVITYTIGEIDVANYTSSVTGADGVFVISNTHVPAETQISVSKVWNDNANQDGVRPTGITVVLFADGVKAGEITLTEKDGWKASFENLPVYSNGKKITYTVGEIEVANYTSSVTGADGVFVISNTHVPEVTQISVTKVWNDSDDMDKIRPASVTVVLFADGVKVGQTVLSESGKWKASFENLPIYADGKKITYTISEIEVADYTVSVTETDGGFVITNTHAHVYVPNMTVSKITQNRSVYVGNQTVFTIVVTNTGDCNLAEVFVVEQAPEGLKYNSFKGDKWSLNGNKFIYNGILKPAESASFDVVFDTVESGNFTNVVVAGSNETDNKTSNNTTVVYTPGLKVQKITLTPEVHVGEITSFRIIVTNTGDCALGDVFVKEQSYDGLVFDSYEGDDWTFKDGIFYFKGVLNPGESSEFIVYFMTTKEGEFTNVVVAGSNVTNNKTANNTTKVVENRTPDVPQNDTNKTNTTIPEVPDKTVKTDVSRATGNPVFALLAVLLLAGISSIRRFKK